MSTPITNFGTAAASTPSGLTGAVDWLNPTLALASDGQYATASLNATNTHTNYLYIYDLAFNLPSSAIIEGISVSVTRKAVGGITDNLVYVTYDNAGATANAPTNHAALGNWSTTGETVTYGSSTDLWGRSWTYADINDTLFGFNLAVTGDGSAGNTPEVDVVSITVYYHQIINLSGSGGSYGSSSASQTVIYDPSIKPNEYEFYCLDWHDIPPDPGTGKIGVAWVCLEPATNKVHWNIRHNLTTASAVRFRAPADVSVETAPTVIQVDALEPTTSPVIGSAVVSAANAAYIAQGLWYLLLRNDVNGQHLRGQVVNWPQLTSGTATLTKTSDLSTSGGVVVGGSADLLKTSSITPSGGVLLNSSATVVYTTGAVSSNGVVVTGIADQPGLYTAQPVLTGVGVRVAGGVVPQATYSDVADTTGPLCGGMAVIGITVPVGGGAVMAGDAPWGFLIVPEVGGGAFVSGDYILQQTYAAQPLKGGLKIWGTWPPDKLVPLPNYPHRGYAMLMKTPNIYNTAQPKKTTIINRNVATAPALSANRYVNKQKPGWCNFGEQCKDAYLPKVVQVRQGVYLPPKDGGVVISNDQIATATGV